MMNVIVIAYCYPQNLQNCACHRNNIIPNFEWNFRPKQKFSSLYTI